jgi:23S rRNA (adenine2030-N6)-methyltransferase
VNYRHVYHAGNFGDVFKHLVLIALIQALSRKDTPFCFIDTHAGIGIYDLVANPATQKSKEYQDGVAKIFAHYSPPKLVQDYLACIAYTNGAKPDKLRYYPGSPALVRYFMREQDRMVLTELHPEDYQTLKDNYGGDKKIAVHHLDGYQGLKAFLPPAERRGLVLIDPPYEKPDELDNTLAELVSALERWPTGIYALWYPIKESRSIARFHERVKAKIDRPVMVTEIMLFPDNAASALNGCGMLIVNPPWQLDEQIQADLPWIWETLSPQKQGRYTLKTL